MKKWKMGLKPGGPSEPQSPIRARVEERLVDKRGTQSFVEDKVEPIGKEAGCIRRIGARSTLLAVLVPD